MKLRELRQIIREEISKARLSEAPLDFDLADKIASGTYQRPEPTMDPNTIKKAEVINKFISRSFDMYDTVDLLNNLGPITPKELKDIYNKKLLNNIQLIFGGAGDFTDLHIYSKNFKDEGATLTYEKKYDPSLAKWRIV